MITTGTAEAAAALPAVEEAAAAATASSRRGGSIRCSGGRGHGRYAAAQAERHADGRRYGSQQPAAGAAGCYNIDSNSKNKTTQHRIVGVGTY